MNYNANYDEETDSLDDARIRILIKLYVLADKLIDLHAANLVIDELIRLTDTLEGLPGQCFANIVYECTPSSSPLRALFRDWYLHECPYTWFQREGSLPVAFLEDIILEMGRIHEESADRTIEEVFSTKASSRPTGHYHQKPLSSPDNNI